MCLDGQLWPLVHLAPFAPFLHLSTLRHILTAAQPFMTSLSLRGMDNLIGADLIATLAMPGSQLVNLSTIDLRGCKRLTSDEVAILLRAAPHLETVNLKGLQAVSSEVIRTLARTAKSLKSLDVSRCWNISLCDLVVFLKMIAPSQAAGLKVLRLAGIKGYGTTSGEFLPIAAERLVNLETLDLLGCTHLFDSDFHRFAQVLDAQGRVSTLKHLIISGCASLDAATFDHLARRMPELIHLEAAGMPDAYRDRRVDDQSLVNLLRSVPKLERLDLEGTGLYGGVTDRVLDILTPTKGTDGVVGRERVELHVGYAREVTSEALVRLVRGCSNLLVLEADVCPQPRSCGLLANMNRTPPRITP
jgi:F-box/leucine-rich repeat protein 2/20